MFSKEGKEQLARSPLMHSVVSVSDRELQILNLIILEYTTVEMAEYLSLSSETIKTHRKHLLEKFNARNVAGLVRRAFECQIVL